MGASFMRREALKNSDPVSFIKVNILFLLQLPGAEPVSTGLS